MCELICSLHKEKESNPAKARIYIEFYLLEGMRVPKLCINCAQPPCVSACPLEALKQDATTGWVVLDENTCTDCAQCIPTCPYGALRLTPENDVIKCDLCGGDPMCVKMCETQAIRFAPRQPQKVRVARKGVEPLSALEEMEEP